MSYKGLNTAMRPDWPSAPGDSDSLFPGVKLARRDTVMRSNLPLAPKGCGSLPVGVKSAKKVKSLQERQRIGTWNIRGLQDTGKQQMICEELDRLNINVMGLSETFSKEEKQYNLRPTKGNNRKYRIYKSAGDERNREGVAFLVDVRLECIIEKVIIKGHTAIGMNINGKNNKVALIQFYIPDISAKKEEVLKAYEIVEELMEELSCKKNKQVIFMGDMNGRTGKAAINGVCGQFGSGETNGNGRILLDFCMKKKFTLKNTYKLVKEKKNFCWIANHGCGKSLIDYIAINEKY